MSETLSFAAAELRRAAVLAEQGQIADANETILSAQAALQDAQAPAEECTICRGYDDNCPVCQGSGRVLWSIEDILTREG